MEKYIYRLLNSSALATEIGGQIYRHGMRPRDAKSEDIIVKLVSGSLGQRQSGEVAITIYVPQISAGTHTNKVNDLARIQWLIDMLRETFNEHSTPRIRLDINKEPTLKTLPERKQTLVQVTLEYNFVNH